MVKSSYHWLTVCNSRYSSYHSIKDCKVHQEWTVFEWLLWGWMGGRGGMTLHSWQPTLEVYERLRILSLVKIKHFKCIGLQIDVLPSLLSLDTYWFWVKSRGWILHSTVNLLTCRIRLCTIPHRLYLFASTWDVSPANMNQKDTLVRNIFFLLGITCMYSHLIFKQEILKVD